MHNANIHGTITGRFSANEELRSNTPKSGNSEHIVSPIGKVKRIKAEEFFSGHVHAGESCCGHEHTHTHEGELMDAARVEITQQVVNSITFLNMTGDITITWDDSNKEKVLALIRKKMSDGYNFFTTKRVPIVGIERKVRVSNKNIDSIEKLVIPDNEFDKLVAGMNDAEVAALVHSGEARMAKRSDDKRSREAVKRIDKAEEVLENQSLAVRPIVGG